MGKKVKVDFTGVADGAVGFDIKPGKYVAKVVDVEYVEKGKSGYPYLKWTLSIAEGVHKSARINHITSLKPEALFNLRNTLIACGMEVPKAAVSIDFDKLKGRILGIEVFIRETDDGEYPNIKNVFAPKAVDEDGEEDDDDEVILE